jgi:hypothetical protein
VIPIDQSARALATQLALFCWYPYYGPSKKSKAASIQKSTTDMVSCRICQRRIGLWAFRDAQKTVSNQDGGEIKEQGQEQSKATFDVLSEHLNWCPIRQDGWWSGAAANILHADGAEGTGTGTVTDQALKGIKQVKISQGVVRRSWWK